MAFSRLRDLAGQGGFKEVCIHEVRDKKARLFAREVHLKGGVPTVHAFLCSDARNTAIIELLYRIPGVRVYCNAGSVVYEPTDLASVIFDHGGVDGKSCGARDYSAQNQGVRGEVDFPAFCEHVRPCKIDNAKHQLSKILDKFRAGTVYFKQETGEAEIDILDENGKPYSQRAECERIEHELRSLPYRYSREEFKSLALGQNPNIILLTNCFLSYHRKIFRIDLQRNTLHEIVFDSLKYAVTHSLNGGNSFKNTRSVMMCFDKNFPLPFGFEDFLQRSKGFLLDFIGRGGEVYLMSLGAKESDKRVYSIL